jgi:hypothetical protein
MPASLRDLGRDLERLRPMVEMPCLGEGKWRSGESRYDRIDRIGSETR